MMRLPGLWRNRDFTILWSGRAVSEVGNAMAFVVLPLLTLTVGSAADAGLVLATSTISSGAIALFAGAVTDRINRRLSMLLSTSIRALAYASIAVAATAGALTLTQLYIVAAVTGLASPFFSTAETAALRAVVPAEQLPTAYSQNQVRSMVAELLGSPLGGVLYGIGRAFPFAANAISFVVELMAIRAIRTPLPAPERTTRRPIWRDITTGLVFIWRNAFLRTTMIAIGIINFVSLWPVLLLTLHDHQVGPSMIGVTSAILTVASLLGALVAPMITKRVRPGLVIIAATWVLVAAIAAMTMLSAVVPIVVALFVGITAVPVVGVLLSSYETAVTPDTMIGRVSAASGFISMITAPAGQAIGTAVYAASNSHVAFGLYTVATLIGATLLTVSPVVRRLRAIEPQSDPADSD